MNISIKRAYESASKDDGYRILVDRLWPRGIKKEDLALDEWNKDIAPSNELRIWFSHIPEKYPEFKKRYIAELKRNPSAKNFLATVRQHTTVTLVFSAKDTVHNQAIVLKEYVESAKR